MKSCPQTKTQNTYEHGKQCYITFSRMLRGDCGYDYPVNWKELVGRHNIDARNMRHYLRFHDCGKWKCLSIDATGFHYENHAAISKEIFEEIFGPSIISELIGRDMDCHLMTPSQLASYDKPELLGSLLLAAWAEINSNAQMFGGYSSISYKIKKKHLTRLTNAYLKM